MDSARWDEMRWDFFRWDVTRPDWDNKVLAKVKNVSCDGDVVVDQGVVEVVADDADKFYRVDVRRRLWDELKTQFKKVG